MQIAFIPDLFFICPIFVLWTVRGMSQKNAQYMSEDNSKTPAICTNVSTDFFSISKIHKNIVETLCVLRTVRGMSQTIP